MLIGLLKYLHKGPKVFKEKEEKPYDELFKMPTRKEVEKKARELLIRLHKGAVEKDSAEENTREDTENENEFGLKLRAAMAKAMEPVSPNDKQFKSLEAEMKAYDANGMRSPNLELLYKALLSIKPTSVSSERAFSISGTFLSKRRARLSNKIVDDLCFSKDFLEKNE